MKDYTKRLAHLEMRPARYDAVDALANWVSSIDPQAVGEWLADNSAVQRWLQSSNFLEGMSPRMVEIVNQAPAHIMTQLIKAGLAKPSTTDGLNVL